MARMVIGAAAMVARVPAAHLLRCVARPRVCANSTVLGANAVKMFSAGWRRHDGWFCRFARLVGSKWRRRGRGRGEEVTNCCDLGLAPTTGWAYRLRVTERKPILGRQVCATTDVGRMRSHNEDTYLVRPHVGLYLVADGMGGHQAGDVASAMVRLSVANFFDATRDKPWSDAYTAPEDAELPEPARRLAASIRKANADVYSVSQGRHFGMGSTVVAIHWPLDSETMYIGHVGDSRAYRLREGELTQLTRDHSLINEALAMDPELTEEDLARLPTNIITRALGTEPGVEVDVMTTQVK
ncbi:MAG TPA: serine/threonine-protein phosphatase, partial [Sorangium sp.]|nr:serine/threonine-protein phosphatase [Sorangium sp.]